MHAQQINRAYTHGKYTPVDPVELFEDAVFRLRWCVASTSVPPLAAAAMVFYRRNVTDPSTPRPRGEPGTAPEAQKREERQGGAVKFSSTIISLMSGWVIKKKPTCKRGKRGLRIKLTTCSVASLLLDQGWSYYQHFECSEVSMVGRVRNVKNYPIPF